MLHFVLGDKSCGKSRALYEEALRLDAQKEHVFFIVPEQNSLSVQQMLLETSTTKCLLNTEVLSFNRLAHRIFEEMGTPTGKPVDDLGKSLLLYQVARENKERLKYYNKSFQKPGFIGRLKLFLTEMEQYAPNLDALNNQASEEANSVFDLKMQDLALLYDAYVAKLGTTLYNSEHILDHLALKLEASPLAQNSYFFFDGFSGFTPQQYEVLSVILTHSKDVTIALTLPGDEYSQIQNVSDWHSLPNGIFHETSKTLVKLMGLASGKHIATDRLFLEAQSSYQKPSFYADRFSSFEEELEHALKEMLHLMRSEGYRLRDIALVMPQMEAESHFIARRMDAYGFGYHINSKSNLSMHPLAQLLFQAMRMVKTDFAFDPVFAFFKTGLTPISDTDLYGFEIEAKACNLHGLQMFSDELKKHREWNGSQDILSAILAFTDFCHKNDKISVNKFIEQIKALFEALKVSKTLTEKYKELETLESSANNATLASQYRRAREEYTVCFTVFEKCLSDMNTFVGDMELSLDEMYDLFTIGFSQSAVSVVPSSVDSLLVADIKSSCVENVKALFVLGLSGTNFPGSGANPGLFTQKERVKLASAAEIAPDEAENVDLKYFNLYSLLGKACERVYISSSKTTSDGKKEEPCLIWSRLISGSFANFDEAKPWPQSDEYTLPIPYMEEHGLHMPEEAKKFLLRTKPASVRAMEHGAKAKNVSEKINKETAAELFEKFGTTYSISKLEMYAKCPYQFFLRYGLRVKVPEEPVVTPLENGNLLHSVLQNAGAMFTALFADPESYSDETVKAVVENTFNQLKDEKDYAVFQTSARYRHYWEKLNDGAVKALQELSQMITKTKFEPSAFEWSFGKTANIKMSLMDSNSQPFELEGKIDRIDVLNTETDRYVSIFDYKSGNTDFDEEKLKNGLQIQLPIYMKAACELYNPDSQDTPPAQPSKPAGFFYFHVFDEDSKYRTNGKFINDVDLATKLDTSVDTEYRPKPKFYPISIKNDGSFSLSCKTVISQEEILGYEQTALQCAEDTVAQIRDGAIGIKPFATEKADGVALEGCQYCAYKGTCGLDTRLAVDVRLAKTTEEQKDQKEQNEEASE